ncbi:hypothetical protein AAG747_04050 [Rapidithrix thailandica]|uniref:DUF4179 domain-containing protein n=1 Tax=Rapidithrix thailandica TaxID=413964 RepID=A0AAW9RQL1_9BACT
MKDEELDRLFREQIENLDSAPPQLNWEPEASFQRIQAQLKQPKKGGGFIWTHYLSVAASISLLFVASLTVFKAVDHWKADFMPEQAPPSVSYSENNNPVPNMQLQVMSGTLSSSAPPLATEMQSVEYTKQTTSSDHYIPRLELVNLVQNSNPVKNQLLHTTHNTSEVATHQLSYTIFGYELFSTTWSPEKELSTTSSQEMFGHTASQMPAKKNFVVNLGLGTELIGSQFGPQANIAFSIQTENQAANAINEWSLGISSTALIHEAEGQQRSLQPATFVEASIGKKSLDKKTGDSFGVGMLIHSDNPQFSGSTFKLQYTKKLLKRINISPELILTENFKKIIPGFKLTLG